MNASNEIMDIVVGAFQIVSNCTRGSQCNDVQRKIRSLLQPPPTRVFFEHFIAYAPRDKEKLSSKQDFIEFSLKIRAAMEMEFDANGLLYTTFQSNEWRKGITNDPQADKSTTRASVQLLMGQSFPKDVYVSDKWSRLRTEVSDASGILLFGLQSLGLNKFTDSFYVSTLGNGKVRKGANLIRPPSSEARPPSSEASSSEVPISSSEASSSEVPIPSSEVPIPSAEARPPSSEAPHCVVSLPPSPPSSDEDDMGEAIQLE